MLAVLPAIAALDDGTRWLLRPGVANPPLACTRAQVTTAATALGADNATWVEHAADAPRFQGAASRLLVEGQRSNQIRNPRCEYPATPSFPTASLPTNWSISNGAGLTTSVLGTFSVNGARVARIRVSGTASSGAYALDFETNTTIVAAPLQTWTGSVLFRIVDSPLPPTAWRSRLVGRVAAGGVAASNSFVVNLAGAVDNTLRRYVQTETLTGEPTLARITFGVQFSVSTGAEYDVTFDVGWPQLEQAPFASLPILPAAGTPAAATRGQDNVTAAYGTLFPGGVGSVLQSAALGTISNPADQALLSVNDGTANRAIRLVNHPSRTNSIRNPRAEYAVAPAFPTTTLPDNWAGSGSGITRTVLGRGTENGLPYVDVQFAGNAASSNVEVRFEALTQIAALTGQSWTGSLLYRLVGGSMANITSFSLWIADYTAGGVYVSGGAGVVQAAPDATLRRATATATLAGGATVANAALGLRFVMVTGGPAQDITLRIYAPQMEQGAFATSPILPPLGSIAAATRPAGTITLAVEDATAGRYAYADLGVVAAGIAFRAGTSWTGSVVAGCLEGASARSLACPAPGGLSTLRLGNNATGSAPLFGEAGALVALPFPLDETTLAGRVATLGP